MIERVLAFSVRRRWYVLLFTIAAALSGAWALTVLPIDAVPDITNVQVQVNAFAPALSPLEVEKQVTFPIEVALAGAPGLERTWSFSRNGFAQVTAVFSDRTDIYFARQQVTERLNDAKPALPPGVDNKMGPISTGLGEVYWWAVEYAPVGEDVHDGAPGWQSDGSYLTPEGERLTDELSRLVYLRTVQDWIIRPQLKTVRGVAGADAIGATSSNTGSSPTRQSSLDTACPLANWWVRSKPTMQAAAPTTSSASARAMWCAPAGASRNSPKSATLSSPPEVTSRFM